MTRSRQTRPPPYRPPPCLLALLAQLVSSPPTFLSRLGSPRTFPLVPGRIPEVALPPFLATLPSFTLPCHFSPPHPCTASIQVRTALRRPRPMESRTRSEPDLPSVFSSLTRWRNWLKGIAYLRYLLKVSSLADSCSSIVEPSARSVFD